MINFIKNIKKKIFFEILIFICNNNLFFLNSYLLSILINLSGDRIYFCDYNKKLLLIKYINIFNRKNYSTDLLAGDEKAFNEVCTNGTSTNFKLNISIEDIEEVKNFFKNSDFYDSHTPILKNKKNKKEKPSGACISFDHKAQLNCKTLLNICLNEIVVKLASKYLECKPYLYSINTFVTFPSTKAFTHNFHRDHDNIKWIVFFINWTDTNTDNGAFDQLLYTHKPSNLFDDFYLCDSDFKDFDEYTNHTLGYDNRLVENMPHKNLVVSSYGKAGSVIVSDTFALHRGTPVKNPRLVTWIRFGVRQGRYNILDKNLNEKINLENEECKSIYESSKYKEVLKYLIK